MTKIDIFRGFSFPVLKLSLTSFSRFDKKRTFSSLLSRWQFLFFVSIIWWERAIDKRWILMEPIVAWRGEARANLIKSVAENTPEERVTLGHEGCLYSHPVNPRNAIPKFWPRSTFRIWVLEFRRARKQYRIWTLSGENNKFIGRKVATLLLLSECFLPTTVYTNYFALTS